MTTTTPKGRTYAACLEEAFPEAYAAGLDGGDDPSAWIFGVGFHADQGRPRTVAGQRLWSPL